MIKSSYPERTGRHFICYCNQQIPGTSDYSIAQAALHHADDILELSQEQLAAEAHLSESSVSRFFHKCGFETFHDFKKQVQKFLSLRGRQKMQEHLGAAYGRTNSALAQQLYDSAVQNMKETVQEMNFSNLRVVVEHLRQARTIYIVGDTRDAYCFYSLQLDLLCSGRTAYLYNIDNITKNSMPQMDEHTALILLSVNPDWYNEELAELCETAGEKGAYRILFSQGDPHSDVHTELCYQYGQPGSKNDGYHSLMLLAQMLSTLFYRMDF